MLNKQQKQKLVEELAARFKRSRQLLFIDYRGFNAMAMKDLRVALRKLGTKFRVVKKTLLARALLDAGIAGVDTEKLQGQIAVAYDFQDPTETAKTMHAFGKMKETFTIIGGVLGDAILTGTEAKALAMIPSRQELLGRLVGSLASPLQGLVGALIAVPRSLLIAFSAIKGR